MSASADPRSPDAPRPARRGRPTDHSGEDTRAAILAAAQRLFGEAGYDGVSMDALARNCGLNARALYYHFASKRDLFDAAADDAFARFGHEVVERVFRHESAADRVRGYVDVYRSLHRSDPHLLSFIGMVLLDALSNDARGRSRPVPERGEVLRRFLESVVDDAIARGEVSGDADRDGLVLLMTSLGMGLSLASLDGGEAFPAMLDGLDRLADGTLLNRSD